MLYRGLVDLYEIYFKSRKNLYIRVGDGGRGVPKSTHDARETDHADHNWTDPEP
jgi:hypothetical protein